jgi:hypothetical protein
MTNTDRIEALEAQVALLTAAAMLGDPVAAAKMLAEPVEAPAEPEIEPEPLVVE